MACEWICRQQVEMSGTTLSFQFSWLAAAVAAAAVAVSALLGWRSLRRERSGRLAAGWQCLRLFIVIMTASMLFRPELVRSAKRTEKPVLRLLVDRSGSMETRDMTGPDGSAISRSEWVRSALTSSIWIAAAKSFRVAESEFCGASTNDPGADRKTDLAAPLNEAAGETPAARCVVLISDGDWNAGASPASAASRLAARGVPVFCVAVGRDEFQPDIELADVSAPSFVFAEDRLAIPFTLRSRFQREIVTKVGLSGTGGESASRDVRVPPMSSVTDVFVVKPRREGRTVFTVSVPLESGEINAANNSISAAVDVRREKFKALIVETLPRWEYRFLRNALVRDPGVDVSVVLFHPGIGPAEGRGYLAGFPSSAEEISSYDVVILGDVGVGPDMLSEKDASALAAIVEQQGSGVVFLPGPRGRQLSLVGTRLGEIMPVTLEAGRGEGYYDAIESRLELTAAGREHLLTRLSVDPEANAAIWRSLPGFFWHAAVEKAKPGSQVLAVHSAARNRNGRIPLVVIRQAGNGRALFLGVDSVWRWRWGVEDTYHYRFWGQMARWMAHRRHMAGDEGMRLFYTPERPEAGQKVFLSATLVEGSGAASANGGVEALIKGPDGTERRLALEAHEKGWGLFTGSFVPPDQGSYSVTVKCRGSAREAKTEIEVQSAALEKTGWPARRDVLAEISAITSGGCFDSSEFGELARSLTMLAEAPPLEKRFRLWCHPLWLGALISLMAAYWAGRKLMGLV